MANVEVGVRATQVWASTASAVQETYRDVATSATPARSGPELEVVKQASAKQQEAARPDVQEVTRSNVEALVEQANESAQLTARNLKINVDDGSGKYVVSVLDAKTDEVIRQFPPEQLLRMTETLTRIMEESRSKGSLIDEQT